MDEVAFDAMEDALALFSPEQPFATSHGEPPDHRSTTSAGERVKELAPAQTAPASVIPFRPAALGHESPAAVNTGAATHTSRVSLADLFASNVSLRWFEAIAIAQAVCLMLLRTSEGDPLATPPLWHIFLTSVGAVEIAAGIAADVLPASLIFGVLHTGLRNVKPVWLLRSLLFLLKPVFRRASLRQLASLLGRIERPGRAALIGGVVARYRPRAVPIVIPESVRLSATPRQRPPWLDYRRRQQLGATAALVVLAATLVFDAFYVIKGYTPTRLPAASPSRPAGPPVFDSAVRQKNAATPATPRTLGRASSARSSPSAGRVSTPMANSALAGDSSNAAATTEPDDQPSSGPAEASASAPIGPPGSPSDESPTGEPDEHPSRAGPASTTARPRATVDVVYDSSNADVKPPIELGPFAAGRSPHRSPPSETATFELVINEAGQVESAQLIPPIKRWDDIMLLSAMKARRFQPGVKDGRPVKYRTRILVQPPEEP